MQSARSSWLLVAALGMTTAACGLVTGLSKDYTFEDEGGATVDGSAKSDASAADGASADGAADGSATREGGAEGEACSGEAPCGKPLICCGNASDPSLTCNTQHNCVGKKIQLDCVRSNDCGLQACCVQQGSNGALSSSCAAVCQDKELCDLKDPRCRGTKTCTANDLGGLPQGFGVCN